MAFLVRYSITTEWPQYFTSNKATIYFIRIAYVIVLTEFNLSVSNDPTKINYKKTCIVMPKMKLIHSHFSLVCTESEACCKCHLQVDAKHNNNSSTSILVAEVRSAGWRVLIVLF